LKQLIVEGAKVAETTAAALENRRIPRPAEVALRPVNEE